ncbi:GntR family transcriptional regulator [Dethiothermospora halolimnae]|uniref:GntR family transcriptional regulator n=1 Tax=Dethiothermospora halolimnae TaxID=3114390 RepID=UPI003CCBEF83
MTNYLSLKDHVYNFIQEKVNDGTLSPNEKISEQMICEKLEISRTPVREALIQLATEGYLEKLPRRGFIVKPIDEKKAKELYTLIGTLDSLAAFLSMDFITTEDISIMERKVNDIDEAISKEDYELYNKLQTEFHNVYINKCDNEELIRVVNQLRRNFIKHSYSMDENNREKSIYEILKKTNTEHKTIIDLFKSKNKQELENYIKNVHWDISLASLEKL